MENSGGGSLDRRAGLQHIAGPPSETNPGGLLLAGEDNLGKVYIPTETGRSFPCWSLLAANKGINLEAYFTFKYHI